MALLGNSFPLELKKRALKVGSIIYTYCNFTKPPKHKYHLICCCDPLLVMLINSNICEFHRNNSEMNRCQVELKKEDHPFLNWDSFLNCVEAHDVYDLSFFREEIENNFLSFYKGEIALSYIRDIIHAVSVSTVMTPRNKRMITQSFNELMINDLQLKNH